MKSKKVEISSRYERRMIAEDKRSLLEQLYILKEHLNEYNRATLKDGGLENLEKTCTRYINELEEEVK